MPIMAINWDEVFRSTLIVFSHSLTLYLLSKPRQSIRHPLALWICISVIMEIALCFLLAGLGFLFFSSSVSFLILFFAYGSVFLYFNAGKLVRNILLFFMYVTFFMLAAAIANLIGQMFFDSDIYLISLIRTAFTLILAIVYPLVLKKPFLAATDEIDSGLGVMIVFEFVAFVSISAMAFSGVFFIENENVYLILLLIFSVLIISSYFVVIRMISLMRNKSEMRMLSSQQVLLENELSAEREFVESARRFRHDMRKHNDIIMTYLNDGNVEEAKSYLVEYDGLLDSASLSDYCENKTLNALLKMTERRCLVIGGVYNVRVSIPEEIPISRTDMVIIFGNLLENAYEGCSKTDDPMINVIVEADDSSIKFEVRNTVAGSISWHDDFPVTTKIHGGTGLRNTSAAIEKYGGLMSLEHDGNMFISRVIIPVVSNNV